MAEEEKVDEVKEEKPQIEVEIMKTDKGVGKVITQKQVDVVERVLKKGKRVFGSAGASLTHQIYDEKYKDKGINSKLALVGLQGEKKTDKFLKEWIKDKPQAVLINSVHLRGAGKDEEVDEETGTFDGGDTDHIIVIGNNLILIDSKNWKGQRKYQISEKGEILRANKVFKGGKVNTVAAKYLWANYLKEFSVRTIHPIITITSEKVFVVRDNIWWKSQFQVLALDDLEMFLDALWKKVRGDNVKKINTNLVTAVVINAIRPYNIVHEQLGSVEHLLGNPEKGM